MLPCSRHFPSASTQRLSGRVRCGTGFFSFSFSFATSSTPTHNTLFSNSPELAHALYQHDAACRVIARLSKERDQARAALAALSPAAGQIAHQAAQAAAPAAPAAPAAAAGGAMEGVVEEQAYLEDITVAAKALSEGRKKRAKADGLASVEELRGLGVKASHTGVHSSSSQITCVDLKDDLVTVSGSSDKKAIVFDARNEKVVSTFAVS
jgi:pre-mRNA-processing factor 19